MSRLSFVKDKSAKYRFCTDEYARLLDCDDANKVVGKKENAFSWSKKAVAAADKAIKDVAGSEQTMILENLVKFPDGTERAMRTKLLPIYNSRNAVVGVFGVAVEVLQSVVAKPSVKGKKKTTTTA